jgi:hypothetical protein
MPYPRLLVEGFAVEHFRESEKFKSSYGILSEQL